tara:strand:+ start:8423 stop:9928 length:1506 start_codon:yes stop_codon:yes gene_type:complete
MKARLILGPPGTGKTTRLLEVLTDEINNDVHPSAIAFVSFTRAARDEGVNRVKQQLAIEPWEIPFFKTLHQICWKANNLRQADLMRNENFKELGKEIGEVFTGRSFDLEDGAAKSGVQRGDMLRFIDELSRNRQEPIEITWRAVEPDEVIEADCMRYQESLRKYKERRALWDFPEMLERFITERKPLPIEVAIIDEAQDLSGLQWEVCRHAFSKAERIYIAGDDDQSIYRWAGADVQLFLDLKAEQEQLSKSWRLPKPIFDVSQKIVKQISKRFEKTWSPREGEGKVEYLSELSEISFEEGTWYILARNRIFLRDAERYVASQGVPYIRPNGQPSVSEDHVRIIFDWEKLRKDEELTSDRIQMIYGAMKNSVQDNHRDFPDGSYGRKYSLADLMADYGLRTSKPWYEALDAIHIQTRLHYREILSRGEKLTGTPRVRLSTIHAVKGGEADHVVLLTDMARRTYDEFLKDSDDEHRVWYVAVTRARESLFFIEGRSTRQYEI